jgi:hypothetical protein
MSVNNSAWSYSRMREIISRARARDKSENELQSARNRRMGMLVNGTPARPAKRRERELSQEAEQFNRLEK